MRAIHFAGSDFMLGRGDVAPELLEFLLGCCPPGEDASGAVRAALRRFKITGDVDDCRAYLRGYGAWEEEDLADHDANIERLVWLTGCALAEGEEAYFSTY